MSLKVHSTSGETNLVCPTVWPGELSHSASHYEQLLLSSSFDKSGRRRMESKATKESSYRRGQFKNENVDGGNNNMNNWHAG